MCVARDKESGSFLVWVCGGEGVPGCGCAISVLYVVGLELGHLFCHYAVVVWCGWLQSFYAYGGECVPCFFESVVGVVVTDC